MSAPGAVSDGSDGRDGGGRKGASAATSATPGGKVIDNPRAASPAARLRRWSIVRRAVNGRRTSPTRSANRNIAGHCSRKALIIPRGHGLERYIPAWRRHGRWAGGSDNRPGRLDDRVAGHQRGRDACAWGLLDPTTVAQ